MFTDFLLCPEESGGQARNRWPEISVVEEGLSTELAELVVAQWAEEALRDPD